MLDTGVPPLFLSRWGLARSPTLHLPTVQMARAALYLTLECAPFDEYCQVMASVGLGADQIGETGLKTLYHMADKDGNGNIDFNEFLVAVVGNLVSL